MVLHGARRGVMTRGVVYFALVFGVGFLLGVVRVLALVPRLGERWAELAEMPLMLVAIILSARVVVRRFPSAYRVNYLVSGGIALFRTHRSDDDVFLRREFRRYSSTGTAALVGAPPRSASAA